MYRLFKPLVTKTTAKRSTSTQSLLMSFPYFTLDIFKYSACSLFLPLAILANFNTYAKSLDGFQLKQKNYNANVKYQHTPSDIVYGNSHLSSAFSNNVIHASELALDLNLTNGLLNGQLHFNNTDYENEKIQQFGFSGKYGRIDYFHGEGQSNINSQNLWSHQDPFHFHGGNAEKYTLNGAHITTPIYKAIDLEVGHAVMQADNLDDRSAMKMGFSNNQYSLSLTSVKRDNAIVGNILSFQGQLGKGYFTTEYMHHENQANIQKYAYQFSNNGKNYSLSFQRSENPLFDIKNENRIMISMGFTLNSDMRVNRNQLSNGARKTATYGATLASSIALLSSGSSSGDSSQRLTQVDAAAHNALNAINPQSVRENREYGGFIYQNADGSYSSTAMIRGTTNGIVFPSARSLQPAGTRTMASVHTHGGHDPRYNSEAFSALDLSFNYSLGKDGYISTPSGNFKVHRVATGEITTLGKVAN